MYYYSRYQYSEYTHSFYHTEGIYGEYYALYISLIDIYT